MIKQTITYEDFNDEFVTEDFYFNFTLLEIIEQIEVNGLETKMKQLTQTNDGPGAYKIFKQIVLDAYGVKTPDGKQFQKSPELRASFENSPAMSEMIIGFLADEATGVAFIGGLLPQDKMNQAIERAKARKGQPNGLHTPQPVQTNPRHLQEVPQPAQDVTAAADTRIQPATPVPSDVTMSTAEKRQYTQEELDAITGQTGTVPPTPDMVTTEIEGEPSDEQLLSMSPRDMTPAQLQRAYGLRLTQG